MARVDYFDDPNAPQANSLVPSVTAVVRNNLEQLLLIHKVDNDLWALPGGAMDIGESVADAAVREVAEETGVTIEVTGIVGIYTDPKHVMAYDDGEVRQQFSVCFFANYVNGTPREDGTETKAAKWVDLEALSHLNIHQSMRTRIADSLDRSSPAIR